MPQIRNVSPYGDLDTPLLSPSLVAAGAVVDVSDEQAQVLLAQFDNWAPVSPDAVKVTAAHIADQQDRDRESRGEPSPSDLKPAWVEFAQQQGDADAAGQNKADLIEKYATVTGDPAELAAQMAEQGGPAVDEPVAAPPPPDQPPAGGADDDTNGSAS